MDENEIMSDKNSMDNVARDRLSPVIMSLIEKKTKREFAIRLTR